MWIHIYFIPFHPALSKYTYIPLDPIHIWEIVEWNGYFRPGFIIIVVVVHTPIGP
jgi:hypothetical protein